MYLDHAEVVMRRKGSKQIRDFEKEYKNGERSAVFLKAFIQKRQEVLLPASDLLDEYVGKLPVDSLSNFYVVEFIYQQGPTLDSRAYKLIQAIVPHSMIDSMYKSVPYSEAVAFNNGIIGNTFRKSVETKNQQLAFQAGMYSQQIFRENYTMGGLNFRRNMVRYYYMVKETIMYFSECGQFFEQTHF